MKYVCLPEDVGERPLVFYLAMEEYLASKVRDDDFLFLWQVSPTVIMGRNQVMEAEVNLSYCKEHGIKVFRRKSGGGCVYSDKGNIMVSYITSSTDVVFSFERHIRRIALFLESLGLPARATGRNDVFIKGRKVSGNAFFRKPSGSIIHGTLLHDTDIVRMEKALTPSESKIASKGVKSVRSHVTNLSEHIDISDKEVVHLMGKFFCDGEYLLDGKDVEAIEAIAVPYFKEEFIFGHEPEFEIRREGRIEGVGEISAGIGIRNRKVTAITLSGDFFPVCDDPGEVLSGIFSGRPFEREAFSAGLSPGVLSKVAANLGEEDFLNLLFQESSD